MTEDICDSGGADLMPFMRYIIKFSRFWLFDKYFSTFRRHPSPDVWIYATTVSDKENLFNAQAVDCDWYKVNDYSSTTFYTFSAASCVVWTKILLALALVELVSACCSQSCKRQEWICCLATAPSLWHGLTHVQLCFPDITPQFSSAGGIW